MKKIARSYYGSRISPNQTKTPEGYLILHNVPIARTGQQDYLGRELGLMDKPDEKITVNRDESEVFSPETIASFEGKPVTSDHPINDVDPSNWSTYSRGITTNVRRGIDQENDLLLADLIIQESGLIKAIEQGKREVSCGYDFMCEPNETGQYSQKKIRGNHVAIVENGRAGSRVAIKDSIPIDTKKKGDKRMPKTDKKTLWGKMLKVFAVDAEPEELAAAMDAMNEANEPVVKKEGTDAEPPVQQAPNEHAQAMEQILQALQGITTRLTALEKSEAAEGSKPEEALDKLEAELLVPNSIDNEEAMTVPVETMDSDVSGVVSAESDRPENPIPGADSRGAMLTALKAIRPIVAKISDPIERKTACDSIEKTFRDQMKITVGFKDPYAAMTKLKQAKDAKPETFDESTIGSNIAKKFNPHYKNKQ